MDKNASTFQKVRAILSSPDLGKMATVNPFAYDLSNNWDSIPTGLLTFRGLLTRDLESFIRRFQDSGATLKVAFEP
jgi:hypothetical protein